MADYIGIFDCLIHNQGGFRRPIQLYGVILYHHHFKDCYLASQWIECSLEHSIRLGCVNVKNKGVMLHVLVRI